jgi:uncharacterized protein
MITLGILSDTHVPDRAKFLNPKVMDIFRAAEVSAILHAGDVSTPAVLKQLGEIAPVYAVRGNRDIYALRHLPSRVVLTFEGFKVGMVHGHGGFRGYFADKIHGIGHGMQMERYYKRVIADLPGVQVMIFGHLHIRTMKWFDGALLFNPGSACCPNIIDQEPAGIGLVSLYSGEKIEARFVDL